MFYTGRLCHEVQPLTLSQCICPVYLIQTKLNKISINPSCSIDLIHWLWQLNKIEHGILCEFDYRQTECNQTELFDFVWLLNKLLTKPKSWPRPRLRKTDLVVNTLFSRVLFNRTCSKLFFLVTKWISNDNCNLSTWFHLVIMCYT